MFSWPCVAAVTQSATFSRVSRPNPKRPAISKYPTGLLHNQKRDGEKRTTNYFPLTPLWPEVCVLEMLTAFVYDVVKLRKKLFHSESACYRLGMPFRTVKDNQHVDTRVKRHAALIPHNSLAVTYSTLGKFKRCRHQCHSFKLRFIAMLSTVGEIAYFCRWRNSISPHRSREKSHLFSNFRAPLNKRLIALPKGLHWWFCIWLSANSPRSFFTCFLSKWWCFAWP